MTKCFWDNDPWTWFPDGDESRARTRVSVSTGRYGQMHGWSVEETMDMLQSIMDFIREHETVTILSKDVTIYGESAFNKQIHATYDRPATPDEISATKIERVKQDAERKARLLEELAELENDSSRT